MEIKDLIKKAHDNAVEKGFYDGNKNIGELLMLVVSELSEALEAHRKGKTSILDFGVLERDILSYGTYFEQYFKDTFEDEIADSFIRLADLCGYLNIDIEKHIEAKMKYNKSREHKHGKKY